MSVVLDRVFFTGCLITMRNLTARMDRLSREQPWMKVGVDLKWRGDDMKVAIVGEPRFILPIRGVCA